jgi:hypothetical protein
MYEFPAIEPHARDYEGAELSCYTVERLHALAAISETLEGAGWPVWLTMTGLAFAPADLIHCEEDPHADEVIEDVADALAQLGIEEEEFGPLVGRRIDEMPLRMARWMWGR